MFADKCLNEAGVAIIPGVSFGKSAKDFVRFSFANSYENIEKALEKIKIDMPLIIRLAGTNVKKGNKILKESKINYIFSLSGPLYPIPKVTHSTGWLFLDPPKKKFWPLPPNFFMGG